jgi:hypothetical protein
LEEKVTTKEKMDISLATGGNFVKSVGLTLDHEFVREEEVNATYTTVKLSNKRLF